MKIKRYVVGGYGTNVYLVYSENTKDAFIVDPAEGFPQLTADASRLELKVKYIIITHGHGDHTGGIDYYKQAFPQAQLVISRGERNFIYDRSQSMGKGGYVADVEVRQDDSLDVGDMSLSFIDTPGHTPGGMCVLTDGVLFAGDTLFCCSVGRTDFTGGNTEKLLSSIREKLFLLPDDTLVLPGHGSETSIGYEKENNPFV